MGAVSSRSIHWTYRDDWTADRPQACCSSGKEEINRTPPHLIDALSQPSSIDRRLRPRVVLLLIADFNAIETFHPTSDGSGIAGMDWPLSHSVMRRFVAR
jgi:hypothetical protein